MLCASLVFRNIVHARCAYELSPISGNKRRQNPLFFWLEWCATAGHLFEAKKKKKNPAIPSKLLITRRHEGARAAHTHTRHAFFKVESLGSLLTFHLLTSFLDYSRLASDV